MYKASSNDWYVKCFDNDKIMSFKVIDKVPLKRYIKIWERVNNLIGKEFDSEPVYDDKYITAKIKLYGDKVNTNFQGKKSAKRKCIK